MIYRQFTTGIVAGMLLTTNLTMAADENVADLIENFKRFDLANFEYCQECKVVESHKHADSGKECHTAHRPKKKSDPSHDELNHHHTEGHLAENNHAEGHSDLGHSSASDEIAHESD